jgi:hypothetical protein
MSDKITADWTTLYHQAFDTVKGYFRASVDEVEKHFGKGTAQEHPQLIAAMIAAMAQDFHSSTLGKTLQDMPDTISEPLGAIADSLDRIAQALETGFDE